MAVTGLTIETEERHIQARIQKKEEAKQKYDDAIAGGDTAYLLEYDKDLQDLLTMNIGSLKPGKSVTVKLSIVFSLEVIDKSWALTLSPTFTPLFHNKSEGAAVARVAVPAIQEVPYTWEVEVDIKANGPIERLVCESDEIELKYGDTDKRTASLSMKSPSPPDHDFVLLYRSADINRAKLYI